jgi:hypothetical protein
MDKNRNLNMRDDRHSDEDTLGLLERLILRHPAIVITLFYFQITAVGIIYQIGLFNKFRLDVLAFAEVNDFLLAGFKEVVSLLVGAGTFFMIILYFSLSRDAKTLVELYNKQITLVELYNKEITGTANKTAEAVKNEAKERLDALIKRWKRLKVRTIVLVSFILACIFISPYLAGINRANDIISSDNTVTVLLDAKNEEAQKALQGSLVMIGRTGSYAFFYDKSSKMAIAIPTESIATIRFDKEIGIKEKKGK